MARLGFALVLVLLASLVLAVVPAADAQAPFTVVASGLNTPRGLVGSGPDGKLYVAEAGTGEGDEQVPWVPPFQFGRPSTFPVGISPGSTAARRPSSRPVSSRSRSGRTGKRSPRIAWPSWGRRFTPWWGRRTRPGPRETFSLLVRVGMDGKVETVADLGKYERDNNPDQTVPDSNPFGITMGPDGNIFVADAGGNDVFEATPAGQISTVMAWRDNAVPTAVAFDKNGQAHATFLTGAPFPPGASRVERLAGSGTEVVAPGLTAVTDLKVGPDGMLYVLEHASGFGGGPPPKLAASSGRVLRVTPSGNQVMVAASKLPDEDDVRPRRGALHLEQQLGRAGVEGQIVKATLPASERVAAPAAQPSRPRSRSAGPAPAARLPSRRPLHRPPRPRLRHPPRPPPAAPPPVPGPGATACRLAGSLAAHRRRE